jgi:hypothetical protein
MDLTPTHPAIAEPISPPPTTYVDWAPIIAGTAIASAITLVLTAFGSVIGLSLVSPFQGSGVSGAALATATGIWVLWVAISSLGAGSYLAGRMRKPAHDASAEEVSLRDGVHGLVVWALSLLLGAVLAAGALSATVQSVGNVAKGGAEVASNLIGTPSDYAVDNLTRNPAGNTVIDADVRAQIGRLVMRVGADGEITQEDRTYLASTLATTAGITPAQAQSRIDTMVAQANEVIAKAKVAADQARRSAILIAFLTAASLLVAGAASWWAASLGGKHRDENTDFAQLFRW